jgi:predicted  nucleic acid-binding Zn-ribbon protein
MSKNNELFKQIEQSRDYQEKIEEENRKMSLELLNFKSYQDTLQGKSKTLEDKLRIIQDRYEIRFKSQEDEIQKLSKESTTFRHENEMLKMEVSDLQFRVSRSEHNEKILQERMSNTNTDYATLLNTIENYDSKIVTLRQEIKQLTDEKNDAEDLVLKKSSKLKIYEDQIRALELDIQEKGTECKNRIRAYDRMKRENDEHRKRTGSLY